MLIISDKVKRSYQWRGYFKRSLDHDVPRLGDVAEVIRSCCQPITGIRVDVVGFPHEVVCHCSHCGGKLVDFYVEVEPLMGRLFYPALAHLEGPLYMPRTWLRRVLVL